MSDKPDGELTFHFIKVPSYRTIHSDGAFGGLTPHKKLAISFFSERFPLPTATVHSLDDDGKLGKEARREVRHGIVREIEFTAIMDIDRAADLVTFLLERIKELKAIEESLT